MRGTRGEPAPCGCRGEVALWLELWCLPSVADAPALGLWSVVPVIHPGDEPEQATKDLGPLFRKILDLPSPRRLLKAVSSLQSGAARHPRLLGPPPVLALGGAPHSGGAGHADQSPAREAAARAPPASAAVVQTPEALQPPGGGAQQHAECSICFDDLCEKPCAVLKHGAIRVCSHFFHEHCARELPSQHCPMCRAEYSALERLPLLSEDAEGWFRCVALGRGDLKKNQVKRLRLT